MFVKRISNPKIEIEKIDAHKVGAEIFRNKSEIFYFKIYSLKNPAALILKQEALAAGAELLLPHNAIINSAQDSINALLVINRSAFKALRAKLKAQPFGLRELGEILETHFKPQLQTKIKPQIESKNNAFNLDSIESKNPIESTLQNSPQNQPQNSQNTDFESFLKYYQSPKIMGILNLTPDSFFAASRAKSTIDAKIRILEIAANNADIIDIGAASSRPGSAEIPEEVELLRFQEIGEFVLLLKNNFKSALINLIQEIKDKNLELDSIKNDELRSILSIDSMYLDSINLLNYNIDFKADSIEFLISNLAQKINNIKFSVDTFQPKVARFCAERGFAIINDISGFIDPKMREVAQEFNTEAVIMHMQGRQETMQIAPHYENLFLEIDEFFSTQIAALRSLGVEKIILDPGLGFGKMLEHNCELLRNLAHFRHFGLPLLIGASRKGMINEISKSPTQSRLGGTLALHLRALENGANIIRAHDEYEHIQALRVWLAVK